MIVVRFMSLVGRFRMEREQRFDSLALATEAVKQYAQAGGFRDVRMVDGEEEPDSIRFTATTPGGRAGRNVAFADFSGADYSGEGW